MKALGAQLAKNDIGLILTLKNDLDGKRCLWKVRL